MMCLMLLLRRELGPQGRNSLKHELIDFNLRKCIHIKLMTETHANLRIELLRRKLSMQDVFEELAQRIVEGDAMVCRMLDQVHEKKKTRTIRA